MKKVMLFVATVFFLAACGDGETEAAKKDAENKEIENSSDHVDPNEPFFLEQAEERPALRIWVAHEDQTEDVVINDFAAGSEMICDALYDFYYGDTVPREMVSESRALEKVKSYESMGDEKYSNNWKTALEAAKKLGVFERVKDGYIVEIGKPGDNIKAVKYEELRAKTMQCYKDLRDNLALEKFGSIYDDLSPEDQAVIRIAFPNRIRMVE